MALAAARLADDQGLFACERASVRACERASPGTSPAELLASACGRSQDDGHGSGWRRGLHSGTGTLAGKGARVGIRNAEKGLLGAETMRQISADSDSAEQIHTMN